MGLRKEMQGLRSYHLRGLRRLRRVKQGQERISEGSQVKREDHI